MLKEAAVKLAALHAGENRAYGITPGQIERLAAATARTAKATSKAQRETDAVSRVAIRKTARVVAVNGGEGGIRTPGATRAHVISSHAG